MFLFMSLHFSVKHSKLKQHNRGFGQYFKLQNLRNNIKILSLHMMAQVSGSILTF